MPDTTAERPPYVAKLRPLSAAADGSVTITVCTNMRAPNKIAPSCGTSGSRAIADGLPEALKARGVAANVVTIACLGLCAQGPNLRIAPCGSWIHKIDPNRVDELADCIAGHLRGPGADKPD